MCLAFFSFANFSFACTPKRETRLHGFHIEHNFNACFILTYRLKLMHYLLPSFDNFFSFMSELAAGNQMPGMCLCRENGILFTEF